MSQNNIDFSGNPTGAGLMDDYLDKELQNILTSNSGIQRPSYAVAGTKWIDMSVTPWLLKMYDGTDDVVIGTIDPSTHKFIASIPLTTTGDLIVQNEDGKPERLASGTAGTVLTSNGIGQVPSWQKSPYQITDNLSQTIDDSTTKYPSNAAVKAVTDKKQDIATSVNYKNITNCITEIPQDIKLELADGVLTLKAGSKVYVPNGFEADGVTKKFDVKVVESDITATANYGATSKMLVYVRGDLVDVASVVIIKSGETQPTETSNGFVWYDTANNVIKRYNPNNTTWEILSSSLPVAEVQSMSNVVTSIDQVFNGFGFIGSTIFALPGVSGLIPNYRNPDGSLKNIEITLDEVKIQNRTDWASNLRYFWLGSDGKLSSTITSSVTYDAERNKNYNTSDNHPVGLICGEVTSVDGRITSIAPKTVFHAVDYDDFINKIEDKFQVASAVPANPVTGTFCFILE